jgi:nitrile hydratase subunit alpha
MSHDHVHADEEEYAARIAAMASLLVDKGVVSHQEIDEQVDRQRHEHAGLGARVVARAWSDSAFRSRLLADAGAACDELGIDTSAITQLDVLENTPSRHHVVVCTLCSCYPRPLLGEPPYWYKSAEYRGRVVREPRAVLAEFGLQLPDDTQIVVMDSTADRRFLVLPCRPAGTEDLDEERLAALVTRDSMVGVGHARTPAEVASG